MINLTKKGAVWQQPKLTVEKLRMKLQEAKIDKESVTNEVNGIPN